MFPVTKRQSLRPRPSPYIFIICLSIVKTTAHSALEEVIHVPYFLFISSCFFLHSWIIIVPYSIITSPLNPSGTCMHSLSFTLKFASILNFIEIWLKPGMHVLNASLPSLPSDSWACRGPKASEGGACEWQQAQFCPWSSCRCGQWAESHSDCTSVTHKPHPLK